MGNESIPENDPKTPFTIDKSSIKSNPSNTWKMFENIELIAGNPRQIADGGLLGICIAVFITLLSIQQKGIGIRLYTALVAFAIAMPVLAYGFLCSFYKKPKIVPYAEPLNIFAAILVGAWIAEGIGWLTAYIGICFVIWHISTPAFIAFLSASAFVVVGLPLLSTIGFAVYAVRESQKQGQKQHESSPVAPNNIPTPTKETTDQVPTQSHLTSH